MAELTLGVLLMLALAAVFLLAPRWFLRARRLSNRTQANRDWYAVRAAELDGEDPALLKDAQVRLLEEGADDSDASAVSPPQGGSRPGLLLWALLIPVAGLLYWQLGAATDVRLLQQMQQFTPESGDDAYRELMTRVERRAAQRPDNLHYQAMLGRFYMNEGDYGRARKVYGALAERAPNDAGIQAMAAQAAFLAAGRQLDRDAQLAAERALSINPHQSTALGLLGMNAFEQGQYAAAINYWERLLATADPGSGSAEMIRGVIERARSALGEQGGDPESAVQAAGAGVTVRLEIEGGDGLSGTETVFLFARDAATDSRMPIAARRLSVADLPLTLRLDDSSSMAGRKISQLEAVQVLARVSPSGQPGPESATFEGRLPTLTPEQDGSVHRLVLRPVDG